ncbi:MAG TPA: DUF4389 domain-containing protein [Acidimicrobiales bacterium]|nr:DUF4389 domain-containing protein [Acidimicrobiales bacterium]
MDATLDQELSRWLWLVKWLLAIPHYVLLLFLWVAFVVVSVAAFFAILFTGRYPPSLFEFNVGVLRWSWRVAYYSYGVLGTDRYPPFTLGEVADYPAHLTVDYPDHLSHGLVLVKWWLLAIPQYLVVGIFAGGGTWAAWETDRNATGWGGGLIGLLVVVAAVVLTFTGRYPRQIFDFVLGMNRWVLRVVAYAALMTDQYPPFRLDMGGHEAGATMTVPSPAAGAPGSVTEPEATSPGRLAPPAGPGAPPPSPGRGWTALRVVSVVAGSIMAVVSVGLLAAGGAATWLDNTQRDASGYLTSDAHAFATSAYAITSDRIDLGSSEVVAPSAIIGTVRFEVTARDPARPVFVGIAPRSSADTFLAGVGRAVVTEWAGGSANYRQQTGGPPPAAPTNTSIWVASTSGTGTQTLTWKPTSGDWTVVVMNPDATPGVAVTATAGATIPSLGWIAGGLFALGGILLVAGGLLIVIPVSRAGQRPTAPNAVRDP